MTVLLIRTGYSPLEPYTTLPDATASGISSAKAMRLLGWKPKRSWRDYLDEDGRRLNA